MTNEKLMFKTAYGKRENLYTPSGTELENEYGYEINKKGQKVLVKTGETNLHEKIQSYAEETKIENIMRAAAAGDNSHFMANGIYADIAEMPKTLIEAKQQIQKLENLWNEVPQEIKNKYNNDVEEFIGASDTNQWLEDMGLIGAEYIKEPEPPTAPELKPYGQVKEEPNNEP